MKRTHHCAQLTQADLGAIVSLAGWVDSIRDQGGIIFIDLRDRQGITQIKLEPDSNADAGARAAHLKPESVVGVTGRVTLRPAGTANPGLATGEIEVDATALEVLQPFRHPAVPARRRDGRQGQRGPPPDLPLPRSAPAEDAPESGSAAPRHQVGARLLRRGGLHRGGDAHPVQEHAGRRARIPCAVPHPSGRVLRAVAVAAAVQADPDGGGRGTLLADRALLPRRGSARRPPDGIHPDRRRGFPSSIARASTRSSRACSRRSGGISWGSTCRRPFRGWPSGTR